VYHEQVDPEEVTGTGCASSEGPGAREEAAVRRVDVHHVGGVGRQRTEPARRPRISEPPGDLVGERRGSPGARVRDEDLGTVGAESAALLDDAGGGFRPTAHVCAEPHSRKSWIVSP
jgi:hypothetical protein